MRLPRCEVAEARSRKRVCRGMWLLVCLLGVTGACGCSRMFWRHQADRDTYAILAQKKSSPQWDVPRTDVIPSSSSRFYDPYNPDCEPLPPDDPAANVYMHWLDGRSGYKGWHKLGQSFSVENPDWLAPFGLTPEMMAEHDDSRADARPQIENLTLAQAIELASIDSREYQTQIEDLYLSALALTFERFQFGVRYLGLGGAEPSADLEFESIPGGQNSLGLGTRFGISQLLPSGGQWIVELANNTLWLFSGPNQTTTASTLSYSLVQPLLLGAGRKVVLENLTQSERNVLYQVRTLARFRKQFFVDIVASRGRGFLDLMQQRRTITNEDDNIVSLREQIEVQSHLLSQGRERTAVDLPKLPEGLQFPPSVSGQISFDAILGRLVWRGEMTQEQSKILQNLSDDPAYKDAVNDMIDLVLAPAEPLDVLQLKSRLANSESRKLLLEASYKDTLDEFKLLLGLPPNLDISINLSMLEPFELISSDVRAVEEKIKDFVSRWAALQDTEEPDIVKMREVAKGLSELREELRRQGLESVERDFRRVEESLPRRLAAQTTDEDRARIREDLQTDMRLYSYNRQRFDKVGVELDDIKHLLENESLVVEVKKTLVTRMGIVRQDLLRIAQSLPVIQVDLRVELITLPAFEISQPESVQLGLDNRLDLMNARAEVMDARRQVEVAANRLEAALDVVVAGDLGTSGGTRPFDFRGDQSSIRAGVRFTAPLDQIAERNAYRTALIAYQRARRDYMAFEDSVKLDVRRSWRQIALLKQNFEIARRAVRIAARQLDSTIEEGSQPVQVGQTRQSGSQGLNLLNAFDAVLQAQNNLIGTWVDYERNRLNIYRDMGIMEIDDQGIWTDTYYQQRAGASTAEAGRAAAQSERQSLIVPPMPAPQPNNGSGPTGNALNGPELAPGSGPE